MFDNYNIKVKILFILMSIIYIVFAVDNKEIPYSELPENERPESLFPGRYEKNIECLHSVKLAESSNPVLKQCYKNTDLFNSPLTTVCSEKCLEQTVVASKIVAEKCDTKKSGGNSKDLVFSSWSNLENAKIFCSKDGKSFCIRKIKDFELTRLQRQKGKEPTEQMKIKLCKPCTEDIYKLIKEYVSEKTIIPRVYYDQPNHLEDIIPEMEKTCRDTWSKLK